VTRLQETLDLAILAGRADEYRAEILVQAAVRHAAGDGSTPRLSGTLTGPRRGRDMTLPTTVRLTPDPAAGQAGWAAARGLFTEPAYWSPELPNLYRLEAEVSDGVDGVVGIDRWVGLRRLGVRGRSFWLDGRRWVPRGVGSPAGEVELAPLRDLHAAAVVADPAPPLVEAADKVGVAIIARLTGNDGRPLGRDAAVGRLAEWSLHPAVMLAVVPATLPGTQAADIVAAAQLRQGTMLVGLEVDGTAAPEPVPEGFDSLVVRLPAAGLPHPGWRDRSHGVPLVAWRRGGAAEATTAASPAASRRECDRLQAELAQWGVDAGAGRPVGDWAGYLVTAW
jgi:hypothetical protein